MGTKRQQLSSGPHCRQDTSAQLHREGDWGYQNRDKTGASRQSDQALMQAARIEVANPWWVLIALRCSVRDCYSLSAMRSIRGIGRFFPEWFDIGPPWPYRLQA